jgi:DNA polymerase III sliding clamp (beta) subunit (PCNA family)
MNIKIDRKHLCSQTQKVLKTVGSVRGESMNTGIALSIDDQQKVWLIGQSESRSVMIYVGLAEGGVDFGEQYAVDFRKLVEILSNIAGDDVNIDLSEKSFIVSSVKSKITLPVAKKNIHQSWSGNEWVDNEIDIDELSHIVKLCSISSLSGPSDSSRPALSSVRVARDGNGVLFVTTDGFRLSLVRSVAELVVGETSIQIPTNFLRDVSSGIFESKKKVIFSICGDGRCALRQGEETRIGTRLVSGDFPPYEKVVFDKYKTCIVLDRSELLSATKTISVVSRDSTNVVIVEVLEKKVLIRTKKDIGGENSVQLEVLDGSRGIEGGGFSVAFNAKYLTDFLSTLSDDMISMYTNSPDSPAMFVGGAHDEDFDIKKLGFRHIIMPIRLSE